MAIVVNQSPPDISFSLNRIIYELQGNDIVQTAGVAAVNTITFTGAVTAGNILSLRYNGQEVRFLAAAVPDTSGNQIPVSVSTPDAAYVTSLIPYFQNNYYLDPDYTVSSSGTTLILTAKKKGVAYNLRTGVHASGAIAQSTAGVDEIRKKNFAIYVEVNLVNDDNSLTKIYGQPYETDTEGKAKIDIAKILHAHLDADLPPTNGDKMQKCVLSNRKYALRVAEASGSPFNVGTLAKLATKRVILGGTPYESGPGQTPISVTQGATVSDDTALRLGDNVRTTRTDQPQYLTFLNARASGAETLRFLLTLYFSDETSQTANPSTIAGIGQYDTVQFAVGFADLNLSSYETSTKLVDRYTLQLTTSVGTVRSGVYTFNIDREYKPYARHFVYVNSLGALETVLTFGKGSETWSFVKQSAERYLAQNYKLTDGESSDFDLQADVKFEVASGWLESKRQVRQFADMFLSRWKFRRHNGAHLPITVNTKEIKLAPDGNGLHAVGFEYQYRFSNSLLSTDSLDGDWFELIPPPLAGGGTNTSWAWTVEHEHETDVPDWVLNITQLNITNWNTAFSWGNHAGAGYLTAADAALTYVRKDDLDEALDEAYLDRKLTDGDVDFYEIITNGCREFNRESWDGCENAPIECSPRGQLDTIANGADITHVFIDGNGLRAELIKVAGVWLNASDENPSGWIYFQTQTVEEFDEEGNQQLLVGSLDAGRWKDIQYRPIQKGLIVKGFIPEDVQSLIELIPINTAEVPPKSLNNVSIWQVRDFGTYPDAPTDWVGSGFLKVGYFDGTVILQAYNYFTGESAYAIKPDEIEPLSPWQNAKDYSYAKTVIDFFLSQKANLVHEHDERYMPTSALLTLLESFQKKEWRPTIEEVIGLIPTLNNLLPKSIFDGDAYGYALTVGDDNQPALHDMRDATINATVLPNAQEGVAYSFLLAGGLIFYPAGAIDKRAVAVASSPWVSFDGDYNGILISGTPDDDENVQISIDLFWKKSPKGKEFTQQRILFLNVKPAAVVITIPTAPTNLVATAVSPTQINLVFDDNSGNESAFELERGLSTGSYSPITSLDANVTNYQDKNLSPETQYFYRVRARNSTGNSGYATDDATTPEIENPEILSGLHGNYYDVAEIDNVTEPDESRLDNQINFITAGAPSTEVTAGAYSVRWSGYVKPPATGTYQLSFATNAKTRIWFGGLLVVDRPTNTSLFTFPFSKYIEANAEIPIIIEYEQSNADTHAWLGYNSGGIDILVPSAWLIPDEDLGESIPAPVLSAVAADTETIVLDWTYDDDPDSFELFGGTEQDNLPLLEIPLTGNLRKRIISGLPTGRTFYFVIRAVIGGRFGKLSNMAGASTMVESNLPNTANPVGLSRVDFDTLNVLITDNNTGTDETYEINFREHGSAQWKTLITGPDLSDSDASPYLVGFPGIAQVYNLTHSFFINRRIETRVRVHKAGLKSPWSNTAVETINEVENQPVEFIQNVGMVIVENEDGSFSDTIANTEDGGAFHAFYFCEDDPEGFLNADGSPAPFENIFLPGYSYLMFRKLMLRKSVYPFYQTWMQNGYFSNITGGDGSNIKYNAQAVVRTWEPADGPPPPPPNLERKIDFSKTMIVPIIVYLMNYGEWKIDYVKAMLLAIRNAGYKYAHLAFSPYKVWNNYTSPGAFDANNLTWNWTNINTLINYAVNDLKLLLHVRLHSDMSDVSLPQYADNVSATPDLFTAWGGYFDKKFNGDIVGMKIDDITTPPWLLFFKFCAAFKEKYDNYWKNGQIIVWEFAFNTNQEAQPNPLADTLSNPNYVDYINRTEQMYVIGQKMLEVMAGWDENSWNVGSYVNEGAQVKGNSMGFNRYATGFKGLRGNHGSDWSLADYEFYDSVTYTRSCANPTDVLSVPVFSQKYFSTEYFRSENLTEAAAMANALFQTLEMGAWYTGFIFDNGNVNDYAVFVKAVADLLTPKGAFGFNRTTLTNISGVTVYTLKQAHTGGFLSKWYQDKNANPGKRRKAHIPYSISNAPTIDVDRDDSSTIRVKVADTNTGVNDKFEFNYREVGTSQWYTLTNASALSTSNSSPLLLDQSNTTPWAVQLVKSDSYFVGKTIQARVRAWVNDIPSNWSNAVSE